MKDYREIHLSQIEKERRAIIMEGATTEHFIQGCRAKKWPAGAIYLWTIGVCGAPGSAGDAK